MLSMLVSHVVKDYAQSESTKQ